MSMSDEPVRWQEEPFRPYRWPRKPDGTTGGIWYGGDYNPDQWPEEVWREDVDLMKRAGVNMVALGIFSWSRLEPREGVWDFDWLDRVVDMLSDAGIAVDMASATATAPLWLYEDHPEVLPVEQDGTVVNPGSRQSWRATSPVFRSYALRLCKAMGEHYRDNDAVVAWHVGNEYGWNNATDYSRDSLDAFRAWCRKRYGTITALNEAWGTSFWSQHIDDFGRILLPRHAGGNDAFINPAVRLDFQRFSSDALMAFYQAERDQLAALTPDKPLTTNFMVSTDQCVLDYERWSHQVDFVSNDHYFSSGDRHLDELLCSDSLVDSYARGNPWCLMEHSTSAVNWRSYNASKRRGELVRDALAHVSMGADAVNFFQWRQSAFGAEAFHSAMVPHAGADSDIYRQVCELGRDLALLSDAGMAGSRREKADVALLFDADAQWADDNPTLPSRDLDHWHQVFTWFQALLDTGHQADVVPLKGEWTVYDTVVLPGLIVLDDMQAERLHRYVADGGHLVVDFASGIMDEHMHIGLGGYPAALRDLTGVSSQELVVLGDGSQGAGQISVSTGIRGAIWANDVLSCQPSVRVLARYQGPRAFELALDGRPAVTINAFGRGQVVYTGVGFGRDALTALIGRILPEGFLTPGEVNEACDSGHTMGGDSGLLRLVRRRDDDYYRFYFNRRATPLREVRVDGEVLVAHKSIPARNGPLPGSLYTIGVNGVVITRQVG